VTAEQSIIHADLDQFFAAVEVLDQPHLAGKPVIVGADPCGGRGRGVVSTASYEARAFGVHSALPISRAWERCPHGVYLRPRMSRYVEVSRRVMAIFRAFTPDVEPLSLDEAFLDVSGSRRLFGDGATIGRLLRRRIWEEERLVVSVGVATTKSVAKIASDLRKPRGFVVVPPGQEEHFLRPLPLQRLWGVGPKLWRELEALGLRRVEDLLNAPTALVLRRLGGARARHLLALARGEDPRPVERRPGAKTLGHETTFATDCRDRELLERTLLRLADELGRRVRRAGLQARCVHLKLRWDDFSTLTRSDTRSWATDSTLEIHERAAAPLRELLAANRGRAVRLIGVSVSGFEESTQISLFDDSAQHHSALDRVADSIRDRFGEEAIGPARLLSAPPRDDGKRF
jgi:nucleotidyltransferase/DNA polymerase involved in DNA repair